MSNALDHVTLSKIVEIRDALLAKQNRGERVYRLESGTPSFPLFPEVKAAMARALDEDKTFYTEGTGIVPLRRAIVEKLKRKNGVRANIDENDVFVGQGGMGTLYCTLAALVETHDTIVAPTPVWESITNIARLTGARVAELELRPERGFNWDMDELELLVRTLRPKALIVVNPGNPTGGVFPAQDVARLFELVGRFGFTVVEDLAYEDLAYDDDYVMLTRAAHATGDAELAARFIPVCTCSKSQNFSGLRIGYTTLREKPVVARFKKALLYTTNGVNSVAQWGAAEALHERHEPKIAAMRDEYRLRRDALVAALAGTGMFEMGPAPKGAFYVFPRVTSERFPEMDGSTRGEALAKHLLALGVGAIAGKFFGASAADFVRFAYTAPLADLQQLPDVLAAADEAVA